MMDDNAATFLEAFDQQWDRYRKQFKAARRELSGDSVHDLRVAARRLLALIDILGSLDTHPHVKELHRFLKKQLDQLDELRDAQVMLEEAAQRLHTLPQLSMFEGYLEGRLESLMQQAHKKIRSSKPSDLKEHIKRIRGVAKKHSDDTKLLDRLEQAVDEAHAETMRAFGDLNSQDPVTIHHVRVAFKNFRYMIETIRPLLPDFPGSYLERMHAYQDAMGKVHDTMVILDRIRAFAQSLPWTAPGADCAFDAGPIEGYYRQRLKELVRAYFDRKDEFNMFWRAAPERPFPWEQSNEPVHRASRDR
jgi:CHAD domain-containing protein